MKTLLATLVTIIAFGLHDIHGQEFRTITEASGPLAVSPDSIIQIVGVAQPHLGGGAKMNLAFSDGTLVGRLLGQDGSGNVNNDPIGNVFTGVSSIGVSNGFSGGQVIKPAVTVRIMSQAAEVVSEPMVLPVVDENFTISLQTSTNMKDWVPAFPGDYLGGSNHRFFRVKAVKNAPAAPAAAPATAPATTSAPAPAASPASDSGTQTPTGKAADKLTAKVVRP